MKIAIINLTAGGMSGGYRKYLRNVIPRISRHAEVESIICATPPSINLECEIEKLPNVRFIHCRPLQMIKKKKDIELFKILENYGPDVVYVPVERSFRFKEVPVVNMLQNMEPFVCPYKGNPVSEKIKNWCRIKYAKNALVRADRVIAISAFVKDFLVSQYDIPRHKIGIIYHGLDITKRLKLRRPVAIPAGWQNKFLFTAGSIRPARGLEDIFHAMMHRKKCHREIPKIVIGGSAEGTMVRYQKKLMAWLDKNDLSSSVLWAGYMDDSEMSWCYENCVAFVMSSRVESFGQTALEAMSHGCLSISADNPCLPEVFGEAAIYYQPADVSSLEQAINRALVMSDFERKTLSEGAFRRSSQFSWSFCADKTVSELKKSIQNHRIKNNISL